MFYNDVVLLEGKEVSLRVHLDVEIGRLALNWVPMPNQISIGNEL